MSAVVSLNPSVCMCGCTPPQRRGQRDEGKRERKKEREVCLLIRYGTTERKLSLHDSISPQ